MARIEKTVFISYRRTDVYTALAVYENLKNQGYDVFFDYRSISSGDFEQIITANIKARAHFLIILTPTALDRCNEPGDWMRREIETAIDEKRNIVPLFFKGFRFGVPAVSEKLTGKLENLSRYNGLNMHEDYFEEGMQRLYVQFLNIPLDTVLHPVSTKVQKVVEEEQSAADEALKHKEIANEPVIQAEKKQVRRNASPKSVTGIPQPTEKPSEKHALMKAFPYRLEVGLLVLIGLCIWGGISLWNNLSTTGSEPTHMPQPTAKYTLQPTTTDTPSQTKTPNLSPTYTDVPITLTPTQIPVSQIPTLGIGSTYDGIDGMNLLYIPDGTFVMGSESGGANEQPQNKVHVNAFWIDRTEVTNGMYEACVTAAVCAQPVNTYSYTRTSYFSNPSYADYPVIFVNWNMAKTYCEWVGRRLPTEAEWEKAARGPSGNVYPWGNVFDGSVVNFCDANCPFLYINESYNDGYADTAPVGSYFLGKSVYGALDMAGNVWEWVNSMYRPYPFDENDGREELTSGETRVIRGGSLNLTDYHLRSSYRRRYLPSFNSHDLGFRCAMDVP